MIWNLYRQDYPDVNFVCVKFWFSKTVKLVRKKVMEVLKAGQMFDKKMMGVPKQVKMVLRWFKLVVKKWWRVLRRSN